MRFAYFDPPYLGMCRKYDHYHPEGKCWDDPQSHAELIEGASINFPDGWAMSASTPSLRTLLPLCPEDVRIAAWVKSFSVFKKGVRPAYAWEPVLWRGGRNPSLGYKHLPPEKNGKQNTPKDFFITEDDDVDAWQVIICPITMRKGLTGAKPEMVCSWILDLLNAQPGDEIVDVYPGTHVMARVAKGRAVLASAGPVKRLASD